MPANMTTCPSCGAERGLQRMPDGSTRRNVRSRREMRIIANVIGDAYMDEDGLMALEAWEWCRNDAERQSVTGMLSTAEANWLKAEIGVSNDQAGW